ncbi:MAG: enoyl-CoA hydratase/isomerase family protein [Pseudomonadota bacterium]
MKTEMRGRTAILRLEIDPPGFIDDAMCQNILDSLTTLIEGNDPDCLIITGRGSLFIRHYDVSAIAGLAKHARKGTLTTNDLHAGALIRLTRYVAGLDIPTICAINGMCMGGGLELALCCDIRLAQTDVGAIGLPETSIGIFPAAGGTTRLSALIGRAAATDFILRGRVVDAAGALEIGIVTETADDVMELAMARASELTARPRIGVSLAKRLIRAQAAAEIEAGLEAEQVAFLEALQDETALAAMEAYVRSVS